MKLLIDVNLARSWTKVLVEAGHEAVHWEDVGSDEAEDAEIMRFADEYGYTILTNDLDFAQMLAQSGMKKPSVVQLRSGTLRPSHLENIVVEALQQAASALSGGAVVSIMPKGARIHILPLRKNTEI